MKKVTVIGGGFSGLTAACYLAKAGHEVEVFEKNDELGGRARRWHHDGFVFDMGPTFYWMPDVLEKFFADFDRTPADYYQLQRLDPGYEIYFGKSDSIKIPVSSPDLYQLFEELEPGSSRFLKSFLRDAEFNYRVAMEEVVYKPGLSPFELVSPATIRRIDQFITSLSHKVRSGIKHPKLRQLLEFPVLFLGAKPSDIPAFYCFMNYADLVLGTWHVKGGMYEVINGISQLAQELDVTIHTSSPVSNIQVEDGKTTGLFTGDEFHPADAIVASADYQHVERLLEKPYRNYSPSYWKKKVMAPSALLYYIGFDKKLDRISHHTLFFDTDFDIHAAKIYDQPEWPEQPLFYASFPSVTDPLVAPEGKENAIILIPVAAGIKDTSEIREIYFKQIVERMEKLTGQQLKEHILFYRSYAVSDFVKDYNAYRGNAYGLSNILMQTAFLKPKIKNKKVKNLFYTGQLTVPGPGIPPTVISGKIAAGLALNFLQEKNRESVVHV